MSINISKEKKNILEKLMLLISDLTKAENEFNINLSDIINKIKTSIDNINKDLFSIAFFGAFSDGKSTILSTLIKKLDIPISPEPTTDKIVPYTFNDYQIIDTPGLFSENLIHDKLTTQYISEANIVIYTVDPVNPIKDSHKSIVKWILSDLKKYDSTIFVINKMDEVADLEDDEDFNENAMIKKNVISNIINEITGLDQIPEIVCIAADPFNKGLNYWEKEPNYLALSRIKKLESLILSFLDKYKDELVIKAGVSVIEDAIIQAISELNTIKQSLISESDLLKSQISEYENRISDFEENINRKYINIKDDFISLRENILIEIDSVNEMNDLVDVIQKNLGQNGYILQERIDLIVKRHTGNLLNDSKQIFESLEESLIFHSKVQKELAETISTTGKSVVKGMLSAPTRKIADAVLKTRNFLKIPIKFKPYGALKFAKVLKAMPVVMEALQLVTSLWSKFKLEKKRKEVKGELENAFKNLIQNMTIENYVETYFPYIVEIKKILQTLEESKNEINEALFKIDDIIKELNTLQIS